MDQHWHGGFSPPGRFLAASIPLLAVCAAMMLHRLRGRFAWSVTAALYAVTLGQTLLVSIRPEWRFHRGVGRATPLVEFFTYTGLDPGRLVPSYVTLGNAWVGTGAAVLAAIALAGWLAGKRSGAAPPRGTWIMGLVAAALLTLILPAALWLDPAGEYPATLGRGRDGASFHGIIQVDSGEGAAARERLVWTARRAGTIELAPRLPHGRYRIAVTAGAQGVPDGPTIRLVLDGRVTNLVPMAAAAPPVWLERDYAADLVSVRPSARLAYIENIEVTALTRHAAGAAAGASR